MAGHRRSLQAVRRDRLAAAAGRRDDVPGEAGPVRLRRRPPAGDAGPRPGAYAEPVASWHELLGHGLNPLVQAATPLLVLAGQLRSTLSVPDVAGLRRQALEEIRRFEERARAAGVSNETVLAARYVLCAALDEAVLSTPWGAQSEWAQQTLLVALHREAWGGEKFFEMLDRISRDPARHIDLMELQYVCLAFGFTRQVPGARAGTLRARRSAARSVSEDPRHIAGRRRRSCRSRWRGLEDRRNPLIRYVPWWVVGAAALAIADDRVRLVLRAAWAAPPRPSTSSSPQVGLEDFTAPAPAVPVAGPDTEAVAGGGRSRAAPCRSKRTGGRTRVTLLAPAIFSRRAAPP